MAKQIVAVGFSYFPADDKHQLIKCTPFTSHASLADADIVILSPGPSAYSYDLGEQYMGKHCLKDNGSGRFSDDRTFWQKEITKAVDSGKTIFIISEKPEEFYYATGEKQYSGTGRSQRTTRIVNTYNSYSILPMLRGKIHAASGSEIAYRSSNSVLRSLWEENKEYFRYQVCYDAEVFKTNPIFFQKKGKDVLGGIIPTAAGGAIVVLPAIELEHENFSETRKDKKTGEEKEYWSKEAIAFTNRFVKSLVEIDKVLSSQSNLTPPPDWLSDSRFEILEASKIEKQILDTDNEIESLQKVKVQLLDKKEHALLPRHLLFETGKPLEVSVRAALKVLGFEAEQFQDSESEFDAVFSSREGHFLGEVEGKDNKAVDVSKISQLMRNVTEYLSKDDVQSPPKAVLFGNGYRLMEPKSRAMEFTDKCIKVSIQQNISLVRTADLFSIVQYLKFNSDENFKQACREAIFSAKGDVVTFPVTPKSSKKLSAVKK